MAEESIYQISGRYGGNTRKTMYPKAVVNEWMAKARASFELGFYRGHECKVCPRVTIREGLDDDTVAEIAAALRKRHFTNVARASVKVRAARRAA